MNSINFSGNNRGNQVGINNGQIHLPAAPGNSTRPSMTVPFRRDPDFVNRETLLDQIHAKSSLPGARVALVGLGGVGKSQLAIEYSYRVRDQSPDTWVFWIHAGNATRFEQSCREIADQAKIPGRQNPQTNIFKLLCGWLHDTRRKWILIFDNLDDNHFLHETPTVQQNCPETDHRPIWAYFSSLSGLIVVTSRSRRMASGIVEDDDIIMVEAMDESHAISLFEKKLGPQANIEDRIQLATALEFIPLAIVQAASYIKQRMPRMSVMQYLKDFQAGDRQTISLLNYEGGHLRRDRDAESAILLTWQISFDHIQKKRPSAADLLSLMSFFDRQGIPDYLIQQDRIAKGSARSLSANGINERPKSSHSEESETEYEITKSFEDDILMLRDYSLISISADGVSFEMHRLVQVAMQEWLKAQEQLERWKECFIRRVHSRFPMTYAAVMVENWIECQALFPHVLRAEARKPSDKDSLGEWAALLQNAASFLLSRGHFIDGKRMAEKGMIARRELFGLKHEKTIESSSVLGLAYMLNGQWEKSEELQTQVVKVYKQLLGAEHPDTLMSMGYLASTYRNQGRWKEAGELQVQVMNTRKRVLGPEHPSTLISMANLASTYWSQGRWKESEELDVQVVKIHKQLLGPEHPNTLIGMGNLASTYRDQGRWKESEELEVQVINTRKRVLGPEHPDTLISMANLASTYSDQERWKEAEELEVQVMNTRKRVLGPEHPDTLTSMANLALTYWNQERWKEGEELEAQVMNTRKRVLGPEHPSTLISMENLVSTYLDQERWKEAEELQTQVMGTRKQVLGPEHPSTLMSMDNLAHTIRSSGQQEAAFALMAECVRLRDLKLGPDHPHTTSSKATLNEWRGMHGTQSSQSLEPSVGTKAHGHLQFVTAQINERHSSRDRKRRRGVFSRLLRRK